MWYVIQTSTGEEQKCMLLCKKRIRRHLYQSLFEIKYISKKRFKQEWHNVERKLFPGYVFIDTDQIEEVFKDLSKVEQFTRILRDGETISPILPEEQTFLESIVDSDYLVRSSEGFLIGDKVCITDGPLRDYSGRIRKVDRHRRIAMLDVDVFGGLTPVEVGFEAVAKLTEEDFSEIKNQNIQRYAGMHEKNFVHICSGIFEGMTGRFIQADVDQDEWMVELELFDVPSKVVFHRREIQMSDRK